MVAQPLPARAVSSWRAFEVWVGTRSSAVALFVVGLAVFALQSVLLPAYPGRDMGRYVQAYVQLGDAHPILPSVVNTRGPLAALGVGAPLELGGSAAEVWLAVLYAASIVAWGAVAVTFGARAAVLTSCLLLVYPGYGILFHGLAGDALFAAGFAGWSLILARAISRPSIVSFLAAGAGMGLLVLIRPSNQVLIVFTLLPLVLRAPWDRRLAWLAAYFIGSAAVTQAWYALAALRYGDEIFLRPHGAVLATALVLAAFLVPTAWRRRVALLAIPCVLLIAVAVVVRGPNVQSPVHYVRVAAQGPSSDVFLFRVFEIDPIVEPGNGPASSELADVVDRELLAKEPYRSYGIDRDEFFSSGSDRMFGDLTNLGGVDLRTVTSEAIRAHPRAFARGIATTLWQMLWARRVFAPEGMTAAGGTSGGESASATKTDVIVVDGRRLPRPDDGQPIPASRFGNVSGGREVWSSATEHPLVFDDPGAERRWERFGRDTLRLTVRLPTRDARPGLVHRLNQASRAFPPPIVWIVLGCVALAVRRPRRSLVAVALAAAAFVVMAATALVAFAVAQYAAPVSPAFVLLAAAGLVGADPRGRLRLRWRPR